MLVKTPTTNGVPNVGVKCLHEAKSINDTEAVVYLADCELEAEWLELTELEYLKHFNAGKIGTDKTLINADGLDTALITVDVHPDITEMAFYHVDNDELIKIIPVNLDTHKAILQVTSLTPGEIRIRAGNQTKTKLNEVMIYASGE